MNWTDEDILRRNREVLGVDPLGGTFMRVELVPAEYPQDLMPEWMFEAEATRLLEEDGWRALRTDPVSDRGRGKGFGELGMADHWYCRYDCPAPFDPATDRPLWNAHAQIMWIEFKSTKGKPKSHQLDWHTKERARGALTLIAGQDFPASIEGFKQWYASSGLQRNGSSSCSPR